ncbi:hypothetical protein MTBBW1_830013 [Desulfamplus magnetovallimortis]|uniref:Uncharacterized protein n=1 Tax=Desulfamplus magnetovallimortis TaxID=1246637 RepID=A0A1W1HKC2_9BACT|nr:hypothetical protein [Desulfamplus magnetovallimortis]SLM32941.1 hypothetical protein MTBBW1_830013 [Desulfamplus magnetovallimortis]
MNNTADKLISHRDTLASMDDTSVASGFVFYFFSIFMHGILLITMIFAQNLSVVNTLPPAVRVDLVSFSPGISDVVPLAEEHEESLQSEESQSSLKNNDLPDDLSNNIPEVDSVMASEVETVADSEIPPPETIEKKDTPLPPVQEKAPPVVKDEPVMPEKKEAEKKVPETLQDKEKDKPPVQEKKNPL